MDQIIKLIQEVSDSNLSSFKYTEGNLSIELSKGIDNFCGVYKYPEDAHSLQAKDSENVSYPHKVNKSYQISHEEDISKFDGQNNEKHINKDKDDTDKFLVKSPIVGTFYSSPSEDSDPYIEVGDRVKKGQVIAIIEAMKIMNEIEAPIDGVVQEILVDNQDLVEFGQPLVVIKP
ncbi:MAG: acetyl-CoA carboxylase biotin carboxyl carrier protein [Clostridiales bacterium]|nr:acetyl-CoA carboxylase biotin carboxyl carrier protein [Clostridiales bacterium]